MRGCRVTFLPQRASGVFEPGTNLRDAALDLGILIDSTCAGIGTCGRCKVEIKEGASDPTPVERDVLSPTELDKGIRLSCQASIVADASCTIPDTSLALIENIAVEGVTGDFALDPDVRKVQIEIPKPNLEDAGFLAEAARRLLDAGPAGGPSLDLEATRSLASAIRHDRNVTALIDDGRIMGFEPGVSTGRLFGAAVDIGTTTMAAKLVDLSTGVVLAVSTAANPQAAVGADVVTRIQHTVSHSGGLRKLSRLVVGRINEMLLEMAKEAGLKAAEISKVVVVGNTVMQHLLLSIDPRELGVKPYTAAFAGPVSVRASEIGIRAGDNAILYCAPNLASYVGSDITSVLVALGIRNLEKPTLVVDMGTNGEMVLTDGRRIMCCSSPAGPAWEGACIHWGMRAARGAIERLEIEDGRLTYRTVGDTPAIGICGSGLIDIVSALLDQGIITGSGRLLDAESLGKSIPEGLSERIFTEPGGMRAFAIEALDDRQTISVSQGDIRQVQLAKAGIASGIQTLMELLDVAPSNIDRAFVAGAFGNHLRGGDVVRLGLIPGVEAERIHFVGNAAMAGAEAMLRSRAARIEAEAVAGEIRYVEIAAHPGFEETFVESIAFPTTEYQPDN